MNSNHMYDPNEMPSEYYDEAKSMYPEIYNKVMPYINMALDSMGEYHHLSDEDINMLTDKIITQSNIMLNPPHRHNRETIHDIVKMLLIMELDEWHNDEAVSALAPFGFFPHPNFLLFPFLFDGRHRRRRHDNRDNRDRDDRDRGRGRY